ncbi:glycosyltransferase family 2 protein [Limosilactobacillus fermentum]
MEISVIMPCYNSEKFVAEAIESFLSQESNDVELIIVDDGSSDGTLRVCKRYEKEYETVKCFSIKNAGAGHARNYGLTKAEGKWIIYLDADDLLLEGSLKNILNKNILGSCLEVDIHYCPMLHSNITLSKPVEERKAEQVDSINHNIPKLEFWTSIYSKKFLQKNNIQFFEYRKQDIETAFRYRAFSKATNIEVHNDYPFVLNRENLESNTHTWNRYNLYSIKSKVYYALYRETTVYNDKNFLLEETIRNVVKYFTMSIIYTRDKDTLNDVKSLLRDVLKETKGIGNAKIFGYKLVMVILNRVPFSLMLKRKDNVEKNEKKGSHVLTSSVMDRLKIISKKYVR